MLLAGAGLVVGVRVTEFPLVAARMEGAAVAAGTVASLACLVVLVTGIAVALRRGSGALVAPAG